MFSLAIILAATLNGNPFPEPVAFNPDVPEPKRIFYVKPSESLQLALSKLQPGDRLVMLPGDYTGSITLGIDCRDGTKEAPIQLVARPGAVLRPFSAQHGLTIRRSHWYIEGLEIVPGQGKATAIVIRTVDAHDVVMNKLHLHDGPTKGISVGSGAHRITIANSHIHHFADRPAKRKSFGIKIYSHARDITIVGNDIHHIGGSGIKLAAPETTEGRDDGPPAHARRKRKQERADEIENDDEEEEEIGARAEGPTRETRTRTGPPADRKNWSRHVSIVGNRLHENELHAIDLGGYQNVKIANNIIWGYAPAQRSEGEAILISNDASEIEIEGNHIFQSAIGIRLGAAVRKDENLPAAIAIRRNFFDDASIAVDVRSGEDVRIQKNAFNVHSPLVVRGDLASELAFDHNLVGETKESPESFSKREAIKSFQFNVFSDNPLPDGVLARTMVFGDDEVTVGIDKLNR